jgi:hypothetical protein
MAGRERPTSGRPPSGRKMLTDITEGEHLTLSDVGDEIQTFSALNLDDLPQSISSSPRGSSPRSSTFSKANSISSVLLMSPSHDGDASRLFSPSPNSSSPGGSTSGSAPHTRAPTRGAAGAPWDDSGGGAGAPWDDSGGGALTLSGGLSSESDDDDAEPSGGPRGDRSSASRGGRLAVGGGPTLPEGRPASARRPYSPTPESNASAAAVAQATASANAAAAAAAAGNLGPRSRREPRGVAVRTLGLGGHHAGGMAGGCTGGVTHAASVPTLSIPKPIGATDVLQDRDGAWEPSEAEVAKRSASDTARRIGMVDGGSRRRQARPSNGCCCSHAREGRGAAAAAAATCAALSVAEEAKRSASDTARRIAISAAGELRPRARSRSPEHKLRHAVGGTSGGAFCSRSSRSAAGSFGAAAPVPAMEPPSVQADGGSRVSEAELAKRRAEEAAREIALTAHEPRGAWVQQHSADGGGSAVGGAASLGGEPAGVDGSDGVDAGLTEAEAIKRRATEFAKELAKRAERDAMQRRGGGSMASGRVTTEASVTAAAPTAVQSAASRQQQQQQAEEALPQTGPAIHTTSASSWTRRGSRGTVVPLDSNGELHASVAAPRSGQKSWLLTLLQPEHRTSRSREAGRVGGRGVKVAAWSGALSRSGSQRASSRELDAPD